MHSGGLAPPWPRKRGDRRPFVAAHGKGSATAAAKPWLERASGPRCSAARPARLDTGRRSGAQSGTGAEDNLIGAVEVCLVASYGQRRRLAAGQLGARRCRARTTVDLRGSLALGVRTGLVKAVSRRGIRAKITTASAATSGIRPLGRGGPTAVEQWDRSTHREVTHRADKVL